MNAPDRRPPPPQGPPGPGGRALVVPGEAAGEEPRRGLPVPQQVSERARRRYADFLPESQAAVERVHSPMARRLTYILALLVAAVVAYISVAEVEQVATAQGVVRPDGRVKVVNHPEGGRVVAIHVREGDRVAEGQVLVELDPALMSDEVGKRRAEWIGAELQVVRLLAEAAGEVPRFPSELAAERPDLAAAETALFAARGEALASRRAQADEVVRQRRQDVAALEGRLQQQASGLEILRAQVAALRKLKDQGYFPELRFLTVLRELNDAEGQYAETQTQLEAARAALVEAEARRASVDQDWQAQVQEELAAALARRDQARSSLSQGDTALRNLAVIAPADGVVQELQVNNLGQAVAPNQEMMKIVPIGDTLVVEARVSNADIGSIELGQPARVKITAYNYIRYGVLEGAVAQISPDAVKDERSGVLTFGVLVRTDRNYMGERPGQYPVTPGMTAEVDLVIGKRTILSYLTDRLRQTASEAFGEN